MRQAELRVASLFLLMPIFLAASGARAGEEAIMFGPVTALRAPGKPEKISFVFSKLPGFEEPFHLLVTNGDAQVGNRVSSATVSLNGRVILSSRDLNQQVGEISTEVQLGDRNELVVTAKSRPGAFLKIAVVGQQMQLPEIVDTSVISAFPDSDFSTFGELDMASPTGFGPTRQGLLRFEGMFGNGPDQIPLDALIVSATLTLTKLFVANSPNGFGHRMLIPWSDTDTWNSMGSGVQFDGTEAEAAVDFTLNGSAPDSQPQVVDVTMTLEAWQQDPSSNFGWLLEGGPTNGFTLGFASSDHATTSFRPILTVDFVAQGASNSMSHVSFR